MTSGYPGIWIVDVSGKTLFVDEQMAAILGEVSRWEIMGHPSSRYIFPEDLDTVQHIFELKKLGGTSSHECRLRRRDGAAVQVQIQCTAMRNEVGEFSAVVSLFTPITAEVAQAI